jgi:hypothetical protein
MGIDERVQRSSDTRSTVETRRKTEFFYFNTQKGGTVSKNGGED